MERAQARRTQARRWLAVKRTCGRPPARRLGLCGAIALASGLLPLSLAASASAAAPPTGNAEASIATAPAGEVAGSVDAGDDHTCGVRTDGTVACWGFNARRRGHPARGHLRRGERRL